MQMQTERLIDRLERLVDRHTLEVVVRLLADICAGKAEHLRANWQEPQTARIWDQMAGRLETASAAAADKGI